MKVNSWAEFFEELSAREKRREANGRGGKTRMFLCQRIYNRRMRRNLVKFEHEQKVAKVRRGA